MKEASIKCFFRCTGIVFFAKSMTAIVNDLFDNKRAKIFTNSNMYKEPLIDNCSFMRFGLFPTENKL